MVSTVSAVVIDFSCRELRPGIHRQVGFKGG